MTFTFHFRERTQNGGDCGEPEGTHLLSGARQHSVTDTCCHATLGVPYCRCSHFTSVAR